MHFYVWVNMWRTRENTIILSAIVDNNEEEHNSKETCGKKPVTITKCEWENKESHFLQKALTY